MAVKKKVSKQRTSAVLGLLGPTVEREYLSCSEAQGCTGVSAWTWKQYALKGRISCVKVGKRTLLPVSEVRRVLAEGYQPRKQKPRRKNATE